MVDKQLKMYCTIFVNRMYEPVSYDISSQINVNSRETDPFEAGYQTPVYLLRLSLDTNNLYSMQLQHTTEFDDDIYAVSDLPFIKNY